MAEWWPYLVVAVIGASWVLTFGLCRAAAEGDRKLREYHEQKEKPLPGGRG